jgi:hypothetical protein
MKNQVINIDQGTWDMLLMLRNNLKYWEGQEQYQSAYDKCMNIYKERLSEVA